MERFDIIDLRQLRASETSIAILTNIFEIQLLLFLEALFYGVTQGDTETATEVTFREKADNSTYASYTCVLISVSVLF